MSDRSSWLKSPVPTACQTNPGLALTAPPPMKRVSNPSPDRDLTVLAFCQERPSSLKSPVPIAFQASPGRGLTGPPPIRLFPLISQIEAWPEFGFCHRMSSEKPSPLKSPVPIAFPARPRTGANWPPAQQGVPFISQIEAWPVFEFCQRMSESPSLLKSPLPAAFHAGPGLALIAPPPIKLLPFISQIEAGHWCSAKVHSSQHCRLSLDFRRRTQFC